MGCCTQKNLEYGKSKSVQGLYLQGRESQGLEEELEDDSSQSGMGVPTCSPSPEEAEAGSSGAQQVLASCE